MSRSVAALTSVIAAVVLSGACSQSPTAPTPTATGGWGVGVYQPVWSGRVFPSSTIPVMRTVEGVAVE